MSKNQCFKIKRGTDYDKAVKKHFTLLGKWDEMFAKVGELLDEKITRLGFSPTDLIIEYYELTKEENKKFFKKDGTLKGNLKKSKEVLAEYKKLIQEAGLSGYKELRHINFAYGVIRMRGQNLESFITSENDIYYKADFNLAERTNGLVIPITEIEYEEKYLEELKKRESENEQPLS